jgi:hypothetical protein
MSPQLSAVGIVTRDRVASLVAALASHLDNCRRHARTPEFIVADGSARADKEAGMRSALQTLKRDGGAAYLSPFFPVKRNSEGVFGLTVHRYVSGSRVAFLPWPKP